jgi:acetyl-CoA acetyltransferase
MSRAAIVGAGASGFSRTATSTAAAMASVALSEALGDCGLRRDQIDGLIVHIGSPRGMDYDLTASALGLNVRFAAQPWSHGRFGGTVLQHAAMAVCCGLANNVLCLAAYNNTSFGLHGTKQRPGFAESLREGGGPHAETPHAGLTAPMAGAAMAFQRYLHIHGGSADRLGAVAVGLRRHAALNPAAALRKPIGQEEYLASPFIVEPLRRHDCSILVDGAVALIVTSMDRAADHARPVSILGYQGIHAGAEEFIFGQPGLGINQASVFDFHPQAGAAPVYRMAGKTPGDVDGLYVYDAFSPLIPWTLERFGHCDPGEALDWIQGGKIELGGALPVNSNGGMLSEGHLNGWGHFIEIIRQLRGLCSERQVRDAAVLQWATCLGDSIIFARAGIA